MNKDPSIPTCRVVVGRGEGFEIEVSLGGFGVMAIETIIGEKLVRIDWKDDALSSQQAETTEKGTEDHQIPDAHG